MLKALVLPYGGVGWEEKKRVLEKVLSSRPAAPFLYNDVLILVPSSRMKRMYGRLFLDFAERRGSAALVQPEVRTLDQFFQQLYGRLKGPLLLDENSRLVLLEGIVKERLGASSSFPLSPDLLAPSLTSVVARMIEQLSGAGVPPEDVALKIQGTDLSGKTQVRLLLDVYTRYQKALKDGNLTDPAGMRSFLRDRFDPAWLSHYRTLIIDGVQDLGLLEAAILKKAANCGDCAWLVNAPSSDLLSRAGEHHPLRIVSDSLASVGVLPKEEGARTDDGQLFLASVLFSDRPFPELADKAPRPSSFARTINLLSAVNTREEVTLLASEVKRSLKTGTPADSILVAFPALDEYGPLVEEIFMDYGIPYNRALGRQLSVSPVAIAVVSLLRACQEDFSGPSLLRVFSSPFLKFAENRAIAPALDRFMRDRRLTGGRRRLLAALRPARLDESAPDVLTGPLNDLFAALEPFSSQDTAPLSAWMKRLDTLTVWSGLGARVAAIHGPLNVNLQAYRKLIETLGSLARAGNLFAGYTYTFHEWLFLLKKTFMHTRFQVPPEDEGGVQILGFEESQGLPWQEIYLGGLVDNRFPQRLPQNIFLPEQTLEAMGVRTLERARLNAAYHFYRLLLSARKVTLTWPENEGDRPMVPSPFLEELTPLRKAGLLNRGIGKASGIQFSLRIEDSRSIPELAKAISLAGDRKGLNEILNTNIDEMSGIRSALAYKPEEHIQGTTPFVKREFWVTELDDYLKCPYDYYVKNVLRIEPLEEVTEDLSPMARGSKVHAILRNFYLSWTRPVTKEARDEARALLGKLADSAFDTEADTFRNRREKKLFLVVMTERFLDAEEVFWKQGMKPAYLEQKIEHYPLVLSNGEEVELSAKIDRIDMDENGNFIIVDYKTGKYPLPRMNVDQDIFQLPVYAVMAQKALSGKGPLLGKPIGLAYYDLAGKTGASGRDVVLFNKEARNDHPSSKPNASPKSADDFNAILKQSMDKARKAIKAILAGDFTSTPQDENKCRYCSNEVMCERKEP
jgi:ATP-dependent helicase/nuclease subunit B